MSNKIFFRLKSEKEETYVTFEESEISIGELKEKIADIKKLRVPNTRLEQNVNLVISDAATGYHFQSDMEMVTAGVHVVGARLPPMDQVKYINPTPRQMPTQARINTQTVITIKTKIALSIIEGKRPEILLCPICKNLIENPVIAECCGQKTGCSTCITEACTCAKSDIIPDVSLSRFVQSIVDEIAELTKPVEVEVEAEPDVDMELPGDEGEQGADVEVDVEDAEQGVEAELAVDDAPDQMEVEPEHVETNQ